MSQGRRSDRGESATGAAFEAAVATQAGGGRRLRLPRSRRFVCDLLHHSQKIPSQALMRECRVERLAELQRMKGRGPKIGWAVLFLKAYGLLSARHAVLRQCYMTLPWAHIYEHPHPIGRMTVARQYEGEEWVFFGHVPQPDLMSLSELQSLVMTFKDQPVESIDRFRQQLIFSRLPTPLRRLAWWVALNFSGKLRADRAGTFGMTTVSSVGGFSVHPPSLPVVTLTFGPVDAAGNVRVTMVYDHRVLDGLPVAKFLRELEEILNGEVREELESLRDGAARSWAV